MMQNGKIPPSFLITFFDNASERLNKYPSTTAHLKLLRPSFDTENDVNNTSPLLRNDFQDTDKGEYSVPVSLDYHRSFLMEEQLEALKQCVSSSKDKSITLEDAQSCLREIGSKDLSNVRWGGDETVKENLFARMAEMNDAARLAYTRSVLWAEETWVNYFKRNCNDSNGGVEEREDIETQIIRAGRQGRNLRYTGDGRGPMDQSAIIEFCGLCSAAVRIPDVLRYLQYGTEIFPLSSGNQVDTTRQFLPQYYIRNLQYMMLRAVGYDHEFGAMELRSSLIRVEQAVTIDGGEESALEKALSEFSMAMEKVGSKAMSNSLKDGLSDHHEGGVTRVTSVKFSEKVVNQEGIPVGNDHDAAPSQERMEEHSDDDRRAQLSMIQKAAALQQSILTSLLDMEEKERNEQLDEAKTVHEEFMKSAMELPPGPERLEFIQNVSPEKQKMLLTYKLWSQIQNNPSVKPPN